MIASTRPAVALAILTALLLSPKWLLARPVEVPLHISYPLMTDVLRQRLNSRAGRAQLWNGENDCQYLYVENPSFGQQNGALHVESVGHLNLGVPVGNQCLAPITWSGIIDATTTPYIAGFALKVHVTDVNLYDRNHQKTLLVGRGFDLIKQSFTPALETYSFDMTPAIRELDNLAQMAVPAEHQAALHLALASIQLGRRIDVEPTGIRLTMTIDLPSEVAVPPTSGSTAPLRAAEVAAWNNALNNWDAFLVFAIKQVGTTVSNHDVRDQLLDILLDSRERLVAALAQPQGVSGPDPVRLLFLQEWTRLGQVIQKAAAQGALGDRSLEFLSFISAGDALFALDQAGSALGLRISAADLRRLARIMAPQWSGDPLAYSFDEDPELRRLFGLAAPLEQPAAAEPSTGPAPTTRYGPPGSPSPTPPEPSGASAHFPLNPPPGPAIGGAPAVTNVNPTRPAISTVSARWFVAGPIPAFADDISTKRQNAVAMLQLGSKLHGVVVNGKNAATYKNELNQLLNLAARYEFEDDTPDPPYRDLWPTLLKATAWQESCWRQFVIKHGRIRFLESRSGDIGLMQVNKYVWRGFYSLPHLQWDIVYNLSAGSEILRRFLGGASARLHSNDAAVLARAAYAAYNGGPEAYNRWRQADEPQALRTTDQAFWVKYQAIASGQSFDILNCASQWDRRNAD